MKTTLIVLALLLPGKAIAATQAEGPCNDEKYLTITVNEWSAPLIKHLIRCATQRWSVPGGASGAIAVANCESSLYPWASNGSHLGLYQQAGSYWVGRVNRYLKARWFNEAQWQRLHTVPRGAFVARANILVSIRMAHNGWAPDWTECV